MTAADTYIEKLGRGVQIYFASAEVEKSTYILLPTLL